MQELAGKVKVLIAMLLKMFTIWSVAPPALAAHLLFLESQSLIWAITVWVLLFQIVSWLGHTFIVN